MRFLSVFFGLAILLCYTSCRQKEGRFLADKHPNGANKRVIEFKGDTAHIVREIELFESGDTSRVASYETDGETIKSEIIYFPNKEIRQSGQYKNGQRFGVWKAFFTTGQLQSIRNYNDEGNEEGLSNVYKLEGDYYYLFLSGYFSNGEKRGTWKFFNRNGDVIKAVSH